MLAYIFDCVSFWLHISIGINDMYQLQAQDVNFAMEASRKSRNAFAAANTSSGVGKNADGISSIKKALDFSFQDVEGLLRLVKLAVDAINL